MLEEFINLNYFSEGKRHAQERKSRFGYTSIKSHSAMAWLETYARSHGEKLPDSDKNNFIFS